MKSERCIILALISAALASAQYPVPIQGGGGSGPPAAPSFTPVQNAGTDVICALHADVIAGLTCNNQVTDGTTATAFTTVATIPAGTFSNTTVRFNLLLGTIVPSGVPTLILSLFYDTTEIYRSGTLTTSITNPATVQGFVCEITVAGAAGASTPLITGCLSNSLSAAISGRNVLLSNTTRSIAANTTADRSLSVKITWSVNTAGSAIWLYSIAP